MPAWVVCQVMCSSEMAKKTLERTVKGDKCADRERNGTATSVRGHCERQETGLGIWSQSPL